MDQPFVTDVAARPYWSDRLVALADAYRKAIFAIILLLYLLGFNGQWRPEPDAGLYLSIGRNIAQGQGYTYHGEPHHLAYPGLPWLWAGVFKVAPAQAIFVDHVIILLTGLACLALCYRLFLLFAGRPMAVFMTLGLAVSRMFYRYCYELRSDMPFLLGVLAFLCGFEAIARGPAGVVVPRDDATPTSRARWYDWALMAGGLALAVVMRPTMWALVGAAVIASLRLLYVRRPRWTLVGVVALVALAVAVVRFGPSRDHGNAPFSQYEQALLDVARHRTGEFLNRIWTENIPNLFEPAASEAMFGLDMGLGLNTLGSILAIGIGLSLFRYRFIWGLFYLFTVLMMVLVLPLDRYFLPVLPLVVYGWWRLLVWIERHLPRRWGTVVFLTLFLVGSGTNVVKIARFIFDQHQRPFLETFRGGRFAHYPAIGDALKANLPPDAWIVTAPRLERILTFYSQRNVTGAGTMGAADLQLLADVDRAYVLNPHDEPVGKWLSDTPLKVGPAAIMIGDPATNGWSLHPLLGKNSTRERMPVAPATSPTGGPTP
jgi:hypothetical protein